MTRNYRNQLGVTFLELLVVVTILGLIAIAATNLFLSLIRGGGKVDVSTEVKQNGQYALSTMEQLIRNADSVVVCPPALPTSIQIKTKTGAITTLSCDLTGGYIAANSIRMSSEKAVVTDCEFTCSVGGGTSYAPLVGVSFTMKQAGDAASKYKQAEATFSTSVVLRKYQ